MIQIHNRHTHPVSYFGIVAGMIVTFKHNVELSPPSRIVSEQKCDLHYYIDARHFVPCKSTKCSFLFGIDK